MKKLTFTLALMSVVAASQATLFNTTLFTTFDSNSQSPNLNPVYVTAGNTYTANLSNAIINANRTALDITWWHTFDSTQAVAGSPAVPAGYSSVSQIISGRVRRLSGTGAAGFDATLTETILNSSGGFIGSSNPNLSYNGNLDTNFQTFQFTVNTPFATALTAGTAQKDNLFIVADPNVEVVIDSIEQRFTPVPEPVTMVALGIGGLGLLAKRRRK